MPKSVSFKTIHISKTDYLLVFALVILSAGTSFLGASIMRLVFLILSLFIVSNRKKLIISKNLAIILIIYSLWIVIIFTSFEINPLTSGQIITYLSFTASIFFAFFCLLAVKYFFLTYINVIYFLAIISLILFSLQIFAFDELIKILKFFDPINSYFHGDVVRPSIVIFTYPEDAGYIMRNSGFAHEPGAFALFISIALFIHITINNFKIDKYIYVFIAALLSSFSTAGYIVFLLFLIYYTYNTKFFSSKILFLSIFIPLGIFFISLDFVLPKIYSRFESEPNLVYDAFDKRITPGRFGSLILDINDFQKRPIFGYGWHSDTRFANYHGIDQQRTNGVSDYLVRFGLLGFIILIYNFLKTFSIFGRIYFKNSPYFILAAVFIVTFGQTMLATPLFFALQFYHLQIGNKEEILYLNYLKLAHN